MGTLAHGAPRGFKKTLAGSIIIHLIVIIYVLAFYRPAPDKVFFTPVYTVNLVDPAKVETARRAAVKKSPPPKPAAKPKVPEKPAEKPKAAERPAAKTVKTKELVPPAEKSVSIDDSIKRIAERVERQETSEMLDSSIEEIRKRALEREKEIEAGVEEVRKALAAGGGAGETSRAAPAADGPPGSTVTRTSLEVEYPAYFAEIHDRVQANWYYPEKFSRENISIIVSIKIGRNGEILSLWVERSSGSRRFDDSLLTAVKKSAPFPPLPEGFDGAYLETGLRFCPECGD